MKFHAYCPTPIWSLCAINIFLAIINQILNSMFSLPNVSYIAPVWSEQSMEVTRCESLVLEAVNSNPLVKTLISALNRAGCEFSTVRHIACEPLPPGMLGGFDKDLNQVTPQKDWSLCRTGCHLLQQVSRPEQSNPDLEPRVGSHVRWLQFKNRLVWSSPSCLLWS